MSRARRARLDLDGLDGLLVTGQPNLRYLTGFTGSTGTLLLTAGGAVLAIDGRYHERAARECDPGVELLGARDDRWLAARLPDEAALGLEAHTVPWARVSALAELLPGVALVAAGRRVETLREVKDAGELAAVRRACAITAEVLSSILTTLSPGPTERMVARRVGDAFLDAGADGLAFPTIVAAGPGGAEPHHEPGSRPLAAGDLVTIDAGAAVDGYAADMTRTVALGAPPPALRAAYDAVRRAHRAARDTVADGVPACDVDAAAVAVLTDAGLGAAIAHPVGHGLGLAIHESPILHGGQAARLQAGMTVTVEPGVYLPGLGGVRIEDTVRVTEDGCEVLTPAPTDLIIR